MNVVNKMDIFYPFYIGITDKGEFILYRKRNILEGQDRILLHLSNEQTIKLFHFLRESWNIISGGR